MFDPTTFGIFLIAAFTLAIIPGPGMLYVLARTLRGGRREGIHSTLGTGVAGIIHTLAAALGISTILATSALAFTIIKWLGAIYLIYLGLKTILEKTSPEIDVETNSTMTKNAFSQGVITEVLHPKTALFFLAFVPQFIQADRPVFLQFMVLGCITTGLTSGADLVVVMASGPLRRLLTRGDAVQRLQRLLSGGLLAGLGLYVLREQ